MKKPGRPNFGLSAYFNGFDRVISVTDACRRFDDWLEKQRKVYSGPNDAEYSWYEEGHHDKEYCTFKGYLVGVEPVKKKKKK